MLSLGLVGCAAPALRTPPAERAPVAEITRFALEGRLQVRDAERSAAVGFDWQHDGPRDEWLFTGPLGQGLARIESDAEGARMTLSDGRRVDAASGRRAGRFAAWRRGALRQPAALDHRPARRRRPGARRGCPGAARAA